MSLLDLSLVSDPAVENGSGFGGKRGFLLELERLSFESGSFLQNVSMPDRSKPTTHSSSTHLGNFEQLLGDIDHVAQGLHLLNSGLHSIGMSLLRLVHNVQNFLGVRVRCFLVHRSSILEYPKEGGQQTESNHGLLVEHVKLIADGPGRYTGACGENRGLRD